MQSDTDSFTMLHVFHDGYVDICNKAELSKIDGKLKKEEANYNSTIHWIETNMIKHRIASIKIMLESKTVVTTYFDGTTKTTDVNRMVNSDSYHALLSYDVKYTSFENALDIGK